MAAKKITLLFSVLLILIIGFLPILVMFFLSMTVEGSITLGLYESLFSSVRQWTLLKQSVMLAWGITLLSIAAGVPLGILLGKSDLPFRKAFIGLFSFPLLLPPYVVAVAWFHAVGKGGVLSRLFGPFIADTASSWLFALPGCMLVLSTVFMPIVLLLTVTFLGTVNPHLEEAARLVAPWRLVLWRIVIPIAMPGILLAALLVFILSLGEFSVPMFLRYDVFPVESFTQFSAFYDYKAGTMAAIPLLLITFLLIFVERRFLNERTYQLKAFSSNEKPLIIKLGPSRWWVFTLLCVLCLLTTLFPFMALVLEAGPFSIYLKGLSKAGDSLARSFIFAASGATILTVLGYFIGYLIHTKAFPFWRWVDSLTILLFALPSTVIAIGLIGLWNRPETALIYGTPVIIILGYVAQYIALGSRITISTLAQIPPSMEEAARMSGARWWRRVICITAPLSARGLIAGWLVGYIFCCRDTGISMMVYPPGYDTLPVRIFTLMANTPSEIIAALCVIMATGTLIPVGALGIIFSRGMQRS
jgi:iron(III) transport system permease protein